MSDVGRYAGVSCEEMVWQARTVIDREGWDRWQASTQILIGNPTPAELLDALEGLYAALMADDDAHRRDGRDGHVFTFYDYGLAAMCEALRTGLGRP